MKSVNRHRAVAGLAVRCIAAGFVLTATMAPSQAARIDVRSLTCAQAINLVRQQGAVVMTLTNTTYDRIVAHEYLCPSHMAGRRVITGTLDTPQCRIGLRCVSDDRFFKKWD